MSMRLNGSGALFRATCVAMYLPNWASADQVLDVVRSIEHDLGARVGFYMRDTHTGDVIAYSEDDRFPLNSTFKLLACGALLNSVDGEAASLAETVPLDDVEVVEYSPAIEDLARAGHVEVSLAEACRMTLSVSDNTAANIVLSAVGGPNGLTAFLRSIGDQATRLDRWEPELNQAVPNDARDTTTPRMIAHSIDQLLLGDALSPASRAILREWLSDHSVADALFRAALPPDWSIHDRTGAGGYGSRSIVGVFYPPHREPVIAAIFITETEADLDNRNAAAARVGAAIVMRIVNESRAAADNYAKGQP